MLQRHGKVGDEGCDTARHHECTLCIPRLGQDSGDNGLSLPAHLLVDSAWDVRFVRPAQAAANATGGCGVSSLEMAAGVSVAGQP